MTAEQITTIVTSIGIPAAIILAVMWFTATKYWPWWTKAQDQKRDDEGKRHAEYLYEFKRGNDIAESVTKIMTGFVGMTEKNHLDLIAQYSHSSSTMLDKMVSHHSETMEHLKTIESILRGE